MATKADRHIPKSMTTNTPPTFPKPNSLTVPDAVEAAEHRPPPFFSFHQRSLNVCSLPSSCSCNIPPESQARSLALPVKAFT